MQEVEKDCQGRMAGVAAKETESWQTLKSLELSISDTKQHLKVLEEEMSVTQARLKELSRQARLNSTES